MPLKHPTIGEGSSKPYYQDGLSIFIFQIYRNQILIS